jgi:threonine/homoserine/homoserine lactone efflux protein
MDVGLLLLGMAIGVAIAAPLGPVNILVIRSTIRRGMAGGLASGFGSVLADTTYAVIAAYGIRSLERFIANYAGPLTVAGGLLLVAIGIVMARHHYSAADLTAPPEAPTAAQLWRKAAITFSTTITNPGALFGVLAAFGTLSGVLRLWATPDRPLTAALGFATGGMLWWLFLSYTVSHLKARLDPARLDRIGVWTGVVIAALGFALLMRRLA